MDKERAKEIVASPTMVDVTYNGKSIYIENVNDSKGTARIHSLNQPQNRQEILVENLVEH